MLLSIEAIAEVCHEANRAYCKLIGDPELKPWDKTPEEIRKSSIDGVRFALEQSNPTPQDSHANWFKFKESQGWKYGPVKNEETKEHPCMVSWINLSEKQRVKDVLFLQVVLAFKT